MTARTHVTVKDAIDRRLVAFPSPHGGIAHGRLISVGGRDAHTQTSNGPTGKSRRSHRTAVIVLPSGARINRPVDQVRLVPEPPRVLP